MSFDRIARNAFWSLSGQVVPIIVAILTVPLLIGYMGIERFGFLSLAWALVGYASMFDFGISRAMTRIIANRLGSEDKNGALHVARVGTTLMCLFGVLLCAIVWLSAKPLVYGWLKVPVDLQEEAIGGVRILAASLPLVLITAAYRGMLEAWQAFRSLNLIRIIMGLLTYLGPLVAALIEPRLEWIVGSITLMRIASTFIHAKVCMRECGRILPWHPLDRVTISELFRLGGWMSVSNLISPLMSYLDRFVLGGVVAVGMLAYYSTPYDMITRTLVFPFSLMAVIFPLMSAQLGSGKSSQATYSATIRMLMVLMFPICFTAIILAKPLLTAWLGVEFAGRATIVLQILAIGVLANTLAQAPANLIQSTGDPKWMAILHILELPVYVLALLVFSQQYGIVGAATCWTTRMVIDAILLFILAGRNICWPQLKYSWYLTFIVAVLTLLTGVLIKSTLVGEFLWMAGIVLFVPIAWFFLLTPVDRNAVSRIFNKPDKSLL